MKDLLHASARIGSCLLAIASTAPAQTIVGTEPVKIFILAGESNMHGKGTVSPSTTQGTLDYITLPANDPTGKYQSLKSGGSYVTRADVGIRGLVFSGAPNPGNLTINYGGFATGLIGPEFGFGHKIGDVYENKVLIVKVGVDGTTLAGSFCPPSSRVGEPEPVVSTDKGFYYKEIIRLVNEAKTSLGATPYEIAGFGWHQGWNDRVTPAYSAAYETNMANFINDIRSSDKGLGVSNMPFVIASAAMDPGISYSEVELAQLKMANATAYPAFAGNVAVVDTRVNYEDLEFWQSVAKSPADEGYHWNRSGKTFLHIGLAMGDAMSLIATNRIPCRLRSSGGPGGTTLTWKNGTETPTSVRVLRNGVEIAASAPANPATFVDASPPLGVSNYELQFTMPGNPAIPLTISHNSGVTNLVARLRVNGAHLSWQNNLSYAGLTVKRDGVVIAASLPGSTTSYVDIMPPSGVLSYTVEPTNPGSTPAQASLKVSAYPAQTAVIYEPFDMTAGALLEGQKGGLGLDGDWVGGGALGLTSGSLAFGTLPTFGNRLLRGGGNGTCLVRTGTTLTDAGLLADGAVLWFSFLHREPDGNINTQPSLILGNGNLEGYFNDISGTSSGIGVRVGGGKSPQPILFNAGVYSEGAVQSTIGTSQVALIVGKITWGANPGTPDTIQIYTPGTDLTLDTPTSHSAVLDQANFNLISMWGNGGAPEFDEIRFGASYADVTGQGVNTSGDFTPPTPATMSFTSPPAATSQTAITMTATTASDANGVQYFFDETSGNPGGTDSGWQDSPVYSDTGLNPSTQYTYTVQARDKSVNNNPNTVSSPASATTLAPDATPPSPSPMTWATPPAATSISSIVMTATTASDTSGVEYYFDETSGNPGGTDSGWQDSPTYTDSGLNHSTTYTYQVKARDKSPLANETAPSSAAQATTFSPETTPPTPNPMTWASPPAAINSTSITMTATTASDVSGVEYFFDETSGNPGGTDSGWQDSPTYTDSGLSPSTVYTYQVSARDKSLLANQTGPSAPAQANTLIAPRLLYWDTNGATAGSGAATGSWDGATAFWNTVSAGNVAPTVAATTYADDLFFAAGTTGTAGTVTVSGTQSAHSITFEEGAVTLSGGTAINLGSATAGSGMSFANVAGYNVNTPIILNSAATDIAFTVKGNQAVSFGTTGTITGSTAGLQTVTIGGPGAAGGGTTFGGIISNGGGGTVALTVNGPSTYTLSAANTYSGSTNILTGTLSVGNASTFTNTSAIIMTSTGRLIVNAANASLAKLATGTGSGVVAGSFLRYSAAQTAGGSGPGTIFGTVELNLTNVNPDYTLDFGSGGALTNLITAVYTSPLTLSGNASIDASPVNATHTATYSSGGITASSAGAKTLTLTGSNTTANTISGAIGNGSGTIGVIKGGAGNWILSGTNTYTGNTRVDAGTLQITNQASLYNNGAAAIWTKDNIIVGNGGTLAFNVGSAGQFTKTNITTLLGLSDSASNGFTSGSSLGIDTTGGSLLFNDVIANTNGGANVLGLTKLGANTLTLDQNNTYTGRTVISAGTLQLGNGGTTGRLSPSSIILNNGNLTINRSDAVIQGTDFSAASITGTGAFTQAGPGTTTLNTANTFSGITTVSAGVLNLTNALALQNSALVTTGTGTVTFTGFTAPIFGGLSGASGDLASVIPGFNSTNLTLNVVTGSVTYGGIIADGAAGMSLTKTGAGTQILSGANSYTGATIVNAGTLTVGSGANGSLSSISALQMGGGTFNYSRTGAGQTLNGLTVNAGNSTVNNTSSGQTLTLGAITRTASVYGTVNFATLTGFISTTTGNTNNIIGPWATTGSTTTLKYPVGSPDGSTPTNISALTGTTATAGTLANVTDATGNFEYSAAATTAADLTANTLRYSGAATATAIGATNTLTLNGLMNAGTNTLTISGGPTTGGIIIGSTNELVIAANDKATTISSVIKDGGSAGRLIYSGAGSTLTLSGANTYSGGLVINSGIVATGAAASVSSGGTGTGPITVNSAGRLTLNSGVGTLNRALTLNGGSLFFAGSGNDLTVAGTIVLGANSTIDATNTNSGFPIITADISGTGGFTKTNLGGLRLNGANTYTGPTVVSAGGVTVKSSLYANDTAKWTPANITVAGGATLTLNVEGAGEFTLAQAATMFGQLSTNVNNNGLQAGSFIGVDTRNAAAGTYTYSANITDSTGAGGGAVSFKHTGTSSTILELTGTNTYSGMSIVDNDAFLKVSSLNSVFTNAALGTVHSASSSLGAPTTVANGTIHLGTAGSTAQSAIGNTFRGGSLIYTGTGETTDRVISLNGGGGETYVLDQSGTGQLKFLSSFASIDNRSVKTITLRGSTTGTGEIAGTIPNAGNGNNQLTKSGTGTWTLSGANLYGGTTIINASGGTLRFARQVSLYNNTEASWTKTNIIVNSGGTLAINVGGTGEFSTGNVTTLLTNLSTSITNNGLRSGSAIGFDTTNAAGGTFTVADTLANSTGTGSGAVGLTKLGTNTLVLTATNNYTGATTVTAGTLLVNGDQTAANGVVNVVADATLGGIGTLGGDLNVANGGKLTFDLSTPAGSHDGLGLSTGKTLTFAGASTLTITSAAGASPGLYTLISGGNNISGVVPATVILPEGWAADPPVIVGNELRLNITSTGGSAYDTWKAANAPGSNPDDDTDGDGVRNAVEFLLGGTSATKDLDKMPAISTSGSDMLFTFYRAQNSIDPKTTATIEVGTNLLTWPAPSSYTVPDGAVANNPGVTVEKNNPAVGSDKITLRVARSPDTRKFARLKVAITP